MDATVGNRGYGVLLVWPHGWLHKNLTDTR